MATTINNVDQSIAWGITPSWVSGQLNGQLKAGTGTGTGSYKDGWGASHSYTYTYQIYGLSSIAPNNFNLSTWNSWSASTQGTNANATYDGGGSYYDLWANSQNLTITQEVGDVTYGEPVTTVSTQEATNSSGQAVTQTIDNTQGSTPITQTLTLTYESTVSSDASNTNGYSDTTTLEIGASVSAEFEGIGASVDTSVTNSTTVDSSTTSGTSNSNTSSTSSSTTVTVDPGYSIQIVVNYQSQNITMPYTAPVTVSGSSAFTDGYGNSISYNAGDAIQSAINYGVPNSGYAQGTNTTGNSQLGYLLATGNIYNLNSTDFTITQYTLISPTSSSAKLSMSRGASIKAAQSDSLNAKTIKQNMSSFEELNSRGAKIIVDGESKKTGLYYSSDADVASGSISLGSRLGDRIYLAGKNQTAYTFGGSDIVRGTKFADNVYAKGDGDIGDNIWTGGGNDYIVSIKGGDRIDAGSGDDKVYTTLDLSGIDDVTLGEGKDHLVANITQNNQPQIGLIVRDLSMEDKLTLRGADDLNVVQFGTNVNLVQNGVAIAVLEDYASQFDRLTGMNLVELSLNNFKSIYADLNNPDTASLTDWRKSLIETSALGNQLNLNFDDLKDNSTELKKWGKDLGAYLSIPKHITSSAMASIDQYDTAFSFAAALVGQAVTEGYTVSTPAFI